MKKKIIILNNFWIFKDLRENKIKFFIFLILIGITFRILYAVFLPITLDEGVGYYFLKELNYSSFKLSRMEPHLPLSYLLYEFFVFSKSEFGVRYIFVILNLVNFFYLAKITNNYFMTFIFYIFNAYLTYHGIIARPHSLTIFLSSALYYHFINLFERRKVYDIILFCLFSVLLSLNFYPAWILILTFAIVCLVFRKKILANSNLLMFSFFIVVLVILFSFMFFVSFLNISEQIFRLQIPSGLISFYIPFSFTFSEIVKYSELKSYKFLYFIFLAIPLFYILVNSVKKNYLYFRFRILLLCGIISYLIIFFASFKIPKLLYSPKYVIWLYPIFLLVLIKGIENLEKFYKFLFVLLFIFINFLSVYKTFNNNSENWKKIYEVIDNNFSKDDIIIFDKGYLYYPFAFYNKTIPENKCLQIEKINSIERLLRKYKKIWLVFGHNWSNREIIDKSNFIEFSKIGDIEIFFITYEKNNLS
jgi:hypothetical protein